MTHEIETIKTYMHQVNKPKMNIIVKWADLEFTATPVGHWNAIACDLLAAKHEGLLEQAHVLALLNMAMMDADNATEVACTFGKAPPQCKT